MGAVMPERVAAENGAEVVEFPWAEAGTAVDALNAAVQAIDDGYFARPLAGRDVPDEVDALGSWQGAFREEFDAGYSDVTSAAGTIKGELMTWASSIVNGANDANDEQVRRNYAADPHRQHGHVM